MLKLFYKFKCYALYILQKDNTMQYKIEGNNILLTDAQYFDPEATLCSGQVFRFSKKDGVWCIISGDKIAKISTIAPKNYKIVTNDAKFFVNYFDFNTNYATIINRLSKTNTLLPALRFGQGVRLLNQPVVETIISFIISANNNIPRIQKTINNICMHFGKNCDGYYAFPTLNELSKITKQDFINFGCGYRADYLVDTIKKLNTTFDVEELKTLDTNSAREKLKTLKGVGPKVADCILLFGLGKRDVFPVDTWIEKVYLQDFCGKPTSRKNITNFFVDKFKDLSGYAQQYVFYYKRKDVHLIKEK